MYLTDSSILEFLFIVFVFGSFPAAFVCRSDEPYSIYAFIFISVILYSAIGLTGQAWLILVLAPVAWAWALKPLYDKYKTKNVG